MAGTQGLSELPHSPLSSKRRKISSTRLVEVIDLEAPNARAKDAAEVTDLEFTHGNVPQTPPESRPGSPRLKFQVDREPYHCCHRTNPSKRGLLTFRR